MFVQVVQGRVGDEQELRRQWRRWLDVLSGDQGWLGSTGGIGRGGELVAAVRFDSEAAARRVAGQLEQSRWREQMSRCVEDLSVQDCPRVHLVLDGGSDQAGFVQVMQGRVSDAERLVAIEAEGAERLRQVRPDLIGGLRAWPDATRLTAVDYFTSEAEARDGESRPMPADVQAMFEEWLSLFSDLRFIDVPEPWMASPGLTPSS